MSGVHFRWFRRLMRLADGVNGRPDPKLGCHALSHYRPAGRGDLSRSSHAVMLGAGSQMGSIEAELDLDPIDEVDVRNELRRLTGFSGCVADFPNFRFYWAAVGRK